MRKINNIFIHCSATQPTWGQGTNLRWKVDEIRSWHKARGFSDIGYHYVIDRDGKVAKGRDEETIGAHAKGWNKDSIGICLLGGFGSNANDKFLDNYTQIQQDVIVKKINELLEKYGKDVVVRGHNEVSAKACPGFVVMHWWDEVNGRATTEVQPKRTSENVEEGSVSGDASGASWVDMLVGVFRKLLSR